MSATRSTALGAGLIAVAGLGLVGYGIAVIIQNFTGFIELGLTADLAGGTPERIADFSPRLYGYISHLQVSLGGVIVALGIAMVALAWVGVRGGQEWALWTAFLAPLTALVIALPMHVEYGLDTVGHLGPIYLDVVILALGALIAYRGLKAR